MKIYIFNRLLMIASGIFLLMIDHSESTRICATMWFVGSFLIQKDGDL